MDEWYTLDNFDIHTTKGISIVQAGNDTFPIISSGNYTLDSSTGIVTGTVGRTFNYTAVNFTYTVTTGSTEELTTDEFSANFSEGIDEISKKVPTVLLIAAIILILGVLAILIGVWNRMRMGGGTEL